MDTPQEGIAWFDSQDRRDYDLEGVQRLRWLAKLARSGLQYSIRHSGEDSNPDFFQERLGAYGVIFDLHKLRTQNSQTKQPLNQLAVWYRRLGIDELMQLNNVQENEMSLVSYRPLVPWEEEAVLEAARPSLVEEWKRIVKPRRPGLISSFSIWNHRHSWEIVQHADLKLSCDLYDIRHASRAYNNALIGRAVWMGLTGRM